RSSQHFRTLGWQREELVERVQLHKLNPRRSEDFGPRHSSKRLLHHSLSARVAIMEWLADQFVGLRQQDKIDAPRIHPNRFDLFAELLPSQGEAILDFRPQSHNVPAISTGSLGKR